MNKRSVNSFIPFVEYMISSSLDENRIKKMLTNELSSGGSSDSLPPEADIVMAAWIDSMIGGLSKNKEKLKSDFIVDYVLSILKYFENLDQENVVENFDINFNALISNPVFLHIMNDKKFIDNLVSIKDSHAEKIVEILKDEKNIEDFKKNIASMMPGFKFVDKDMFGF